ncbi:MAG TPA: hypothetical protein VHF92_17405 [Geodermatophilus sp.]|nr:hypothetical protein [Geodermatophilus sp.]
MDVTTVNDRHLYRATVVVRDPQNPDRQVEMPGRIIRFGPPGWLTVVDPRVGGEVITLYPVGQVLVVYALREGGAAASGG